MATTVKDKNTVTSTEKKDAFLDEINEDVKLQTGGENEPEEKQTGPIALAQQTDAVLFQNWDDVREDEFIEVSGSYLELDVDESITLQFFGLTTQMMPDINDPTNGDVPVTVANFYDKDRNRFYSAQSYITSSFKNATPGAICRITGKGKTQSSNNKNWQYNNYKVEIMARYLQSSR